MILYMKKLTRRNKNKTKTRTKSRRNKCGGAAAVNTNVSHHIYDRVNNADQIGILEDILNRDEGVIQQALLQLLPNPAYGDIRVEVNKLPKGLYLNWKHVGHIGNPNIRPLLHVSIHTGVAPNGASQAKLRSYFQKGNMHIKFDLKALPLTINKRDLPNFVKLILDNDTMMIRHELGRDLTDSPGDEIISKIIRLLQKYVDENM